MQTNNLYHYIKTGAFLHEIKSIPNCVVWEAIPDLSQMPATRTKTDHTSFEQLGYDFRPEGSVVSHIKEKKKIFLILDTLSIAEVIPMLPSLPKDISCIIINLGVGISGVQNKHSIENNDRALLGELLPIYEPIDTTHFLRIMHSEEVMYIRVANDEIPDVLFTDGKESLYDEKDIPMTSFGYAGIGGTILIQPTLLVTVTQALQYIQTTHGIGYDLFVHTGPRTQYSQQLVDSLHHTGKLIVIHDQVDSDAIRIAEQKICTASNLQGEVQVFFKKPDYTKITTILPEYMYEQIGYTSESLTHYLTSLN